MGEHRIFTNHWISAQAPVRPAVATHIDEVLDGSLSSGSMLSSEAQKRHHGEAAILDLILLICLVLGALGHSEGVKVSAA